MIKCWVPGCNAAATIFAETPTDNVPFCASCHEKLISNAIASFPKAYARIIRSCMEHASHPILEGGSS